MCFWKLPRVSWKTPIPLPLLTDVLEYQLWLILFKLQNAIYEPRVSTYWYSTTSASRGVGRWGIVGGRGYGGVLCSIKSNSAEKICLQLKSSCELYFNWSFPHKLRELYKSSLREREICFGVLWLEFMKIWWAMTPSWTQWYDIRLLSWQTR